MEIKSIKYSDIRQKIQTCDLIEFAADTALGCAIRNITGRRVNHTSVAIWSKPGIDVQDSFFMPLRLYIAEAIGNGFRQSFLSAKLHGYAGRAYWSELKPEYDTKRCLILKELLALEGIDYDYVALIKNLWRRVPVNEGDVYCSEAFQIALRNAGLLPADYSPTGFRKHQGTGMRPGEFEDTGLFLDPVEIIL